MSEHLSRYEDPETGEFQMQLFEDEAYDRHHVMYTRREHSKNGDTKLLRRKLVIPMFVSDHKELHAEVPPPVVPSRGLARVAFDLIITSQEETMLGRFDELTEEMLRLARTDKTHMGDEAWMLHDNFVEQRQFMDRAHYLGEIALLKGEHNHECE